MMTTILRPAAAVEPAAVDPLHAHGGARHVTESLTIALDASAATTLEGLRRVDLTAPAVRALHALDAADRIALLPTRLGAPCAGALVLALIWRIDGSRAAERIEPHAFEAFTSPGHVKVRWEIQVAPAGEDRAFLSIATRFAATDDRSRARLLDAWGLVGALNRTLVERAARSVKAYGGRPRTGRARRLISTPDAPPGRPPGDSAAAFTTSNGRMA